MTKLFQLRMKELRLKKGMTQKQLAEKTGITYALISRYENDKQTPRAETVERIANALDCPASYFLEALVEEMPDVDFVLVPFYDSDAVFSMLKDFIKKLNVSYQHIFAWQNTGESMAPTLADGDIVIFDSSQNQPREQNLFAIIRDDSSIVIKRLLREKSGDWIYQSDNPNKSLYPNMYPLDSDQILGRVVWRGGSLL